MNAETVTKELERIANEARGSVESVQAEIKSLKEKNQTLVEQNEGLAARFQELEQNALTSMRGQRFATPRKSLAEQFRESDGFKSMVERESKSATIRVDQSLKNLVNDGASGDSGDSTYDTHPQRDPRLANDARRPLSLLDALPSLQVGSSTFEYVQLDGYSNAAAEQASEGSTKAEASLPTAVKSVRIATIAHFMKASEQVLQDNAALQAQIDSLLRYGVLAKAESLIVSGTGDIDGLEAEGTAFTADSGLGLADAISDAEAALEADGWRASHVLLNPQDWHSIRTERGNDGYVAGGWNMPAAPNIWGLQAIATPSVTQGQPIVLDASQVAILDRMSVVTEAFREDATNVQQNLVTLRSEARIGFAVFAPSAVRLVSTV